jgi:endonuclease YncB( thermonuclease family)
MAFGISLGASLSTGLAQSRVPVSPTELPHPIWTLVPTHIDRSKEHHDRVDPLRADMDHLVVTVDRPVRLGPAGTFLVAGKPMQIFGLVLPDRQKLCETASGLRWACGTRSLATFVGLLTARGLVCERLSPMGASVTVARCKSGNEDIAERMIGDGWAEADPKAELRLKSLEDAARKAHRGQWAETSPEF